MKNLFVLGLLFLTGCALLPTTPGTIKLHESKVDGAKELSMDPGICAEQFIKIGFLKTTRMKPDEVVLKLTLDGVHGIANGESLIFNIDGQTITLKTEQAFTEFGENMGGYATSNKNYKTNIEFLNKLNSAKVAHLQILLSNGKYLETDYNNTTSWGSKTALPKFLSQIDQVK
jgi:hypothetical protein